MIASLFSWSPIIPKNIKVCGKPTIYTKREQSKFNPIYEDDKGLHYTDLFFYEVFEIHKKSTYKNYNRLYTEMKRRYPILAKEETIKFKDICMSNFPRIAQKKVEIEIFNNSIFTEYSKENNNTTNFNDMWKKGLGFIEKGRWSQSKTNNYIKYLNEKSEDGKLFLKNKIDWTKVSRDFNHTGQSCYNKYMSLKKGLINGLQNK